jgi:uncharacterized protein
VNEQSTSSHVGAPPRPWRERIIELDALRGFALLGILLINVLGFSGVRALSIEPEGLDRILEGFFRNFAQGKFMSLFALLFGISFTLQSISLKRQGVGLCPVWWRRLGVLFLLGMLHTFLEPSEVLAVYALCGALLVMLRRIPGPLVMVIALVAMGMPHLHTALVTPVYVTDTIVTDASKETEPPMTMEEAEQATAAGLDPQTSAPIEIREKDMHAWNPYLGDLAIRVHSSGTFAEVVEYNHLFTMRRWVGSWVGYLWMLVPLPMMLVGLLIGRSGLLTRLTEETPRLKRVCGSGFVAGVVAVWLSSVLYGVAGRNGWNPWVAFPANWLFSLSGLFMALAYAAGLLWLLQTKIGEHLQNIFAPIGRMALTNYLLQTVICTSLFFGFGFGLYGRVGASQTTLIALAVFTIQVIFSRLWLLRFNFGPVEWLWRVATYWRILSPTKT